MRGPGERPAIVFDMDGVLVDTEPLKARAHRAAVESRGGELTLDLYRREMGGAHEDVVRTFLRASGLDATPDALEAYEGTFRSAYRELIETELTPTEGATDLLDRCRGQDRPVALVTSSERWMVEIVLPRLSAGGLFRAVVTADDVEREKPAPDPYRRARSALGSAAARAAAVEDTRAGIASARAAGLPVIAVRHRFNRGHAFDGAAAEVESLSPAGAFLEIVDRVAADGPGS